MPLHYFKNATLLLLALAGTLLSGAGAFATTYSIAVVPQYNVVQLHTEWQPLLERIARDSGITLELSFQSSIPKFERALLKGEPDFAYANPYHAVMAKNAQGYLPIVRDSKALTGILLVRKDSPYKILTDLTGKEIGFPAPNAFGASLYMRALLAEKKIKFEPLFLNTHGNVFRSIINGSVAAGGAVNNTYNDERAEIRDQLRIIFQTQGSASHPVIVHPRVPEAVRAAVKAAFLALQKDPAGVAMLKEVRLPQPLAASYESDYLPLEKLGIEKFVILEKE
jgi:phosphonate transport system substrate-binding protein